MSARTLVFHHIPKTAGTSVRTALMNLFGESGCAHIQNVDLTSTRQMQRVLRGSDPPLVCGHIPVRYVHPDWRGGALTFLREPVARVLSLYRFMSGQDPAIYAETGLRPGFSLGEFLACRDPGLVAQIDNGMCRFLARGDASWPIDCAAPEAVTPDDLTLRSALETLDETCVCICERMDESLSRLGRAWGAPFPIQAFQENAARAVVAVTAEEVAQIRERNALDQILYERALRAFDEGTFNAPKMCRPAAQVWRAGEHYAVNQIPMRGGFHAFEEEPGIAWLEARKSAFIAFDLGERQELGLELRFYRGKHDFPVERSQFLVNGAPVPLHVSGNGMCTAFVGPFVGNAGPNLLEMRTPRTALRATPADLDSRPLACALATISVNESA